MKECNQKHKPELHQGKEKQLTAMQKNRVNGKHGGGLAIYAHDYLPSSYLVNPTPFPEYPETFETETIFSNTKKSQFALYNVYDP
ncbi:hypothetical protein CHS0354_041639, partial [Potamilus streckersoni]